MTARCQVCRWPTDRLAGKGVSVPTIRKANAADVDALGAMLGRSFDDDPVYRCIFPDDQQRRAALPLLFSHWLRHIHLPHDLVYTEDGHAGASLWAPPNEWNIGLLTQLRLAPKLLSVFGRRIFVTMKILGEMQARHPKTPHHYLAVVGTDPSQQGKGVGAALLAPMLARCDEEQMPAYLESSNEKNHSFYRRHGFEVTDSFPTPPGPKIWLMWREPRARDA